jgi:hypothetical protein
MSDIGTAAPARTARESQQDRSGSAERSATEQVQDKAQEAAGQAQEKVQEAAGQAQEKVQEAAGQLQHRVREQLDQRSTQIGEQIGTQASDLRSVGDSLRQQGKEGPAKAADQIAEYVERAGSYLREKDPDTVLADAERFGRRQPWAVAAGGVALGFLASRFLKASSRRRYEGLTVPRPAGVYPAPTGASGAAPDGTAGLGAQSTLPGA